MEMPMVAGSTTVGACVGVEVEWKGDPQAKDVEADSPRMEVAAVSFHVEEEEA